MISYSRTGHIVPLFTCDPSNDKETVPLNGGLGTLASLIKLINISGPQINNTSAITNPPPTATLLIRLCFSPRSLG